MCFEITKQKAFTILRIFQQNTNPLVIEESKVLNINPFLFPGHGEHITLIIKEYPTETKKHKTTHPLRVNAGVYKNPNDLFAQLREIRKCQLRL